MNLTPDWIVGFVDGEGSFYIGINSHTEMTTGYQVLPDFRVVQHKRDVQILYALKRFFKCGVVRVNHDDRYEYRVRKIEDLKRIVNFFEKHPLKTQKNIDFKKFAKIVKWIEMGEHLRITGLIKIIEVAEKMNRENKIKAEEILQELRKKVDKDIVHP